MALKTVTEIKYEFYFVDEATGEAILRVPYKTVEEGMKALPEAKKAIPDVTLKLDKVERVTLVALVEEVKICG